MDIQTLSQSLCKLVSIDAMMLSSSAIKKILLAPLEEIRSRQKAFLFYGEKITSCHRDFVIQDSVPTTTSVADLKASRDNFLLAYWSWSPPRSLFLVVVLVLVLASAVQDSALNSTD